MKPENLVKILMVFSILVCFAQPVLAAEETQKDEATAYYNQAEILVVSGEYARAIALFDKALASNTTMIRQSDALLYTYRDKAYAQIQLNDFENASKTLDAGISEYGGDQMLWNNKGFVLFKMGSYPDALTAYNRAILIEPNYTVALMNKGDVLYQMGRYNEAVDAYKQALESDPGNTYATENLVKAENAAGSLSTTMISVVIIIILIIAGGAYWHLKIRKPADEKPAKSGKKEKK